MMNIGMSYLNLFILLAAIATVLISLGVWLFLRRDHVINAAISWFESYGLESRYIEVEGERVHYVQTGHGPHIVFLHGIGASLFTWRHILPLLAKSYTVTAIDLPGFGRSHKTKSSDYGLDSQRRRVQKALDLLLIDSAHLVGSSMGGAIALWMATEDPDRFPKVAVLAPATNPKVVPLSFVKLLAFVPYTHRVVNRRTMRWIYGYVVAKKELIVPETVDAYLEPYLDEGISARSFLNAVELLADRRMPNCFKDVRSEVLIIGGERDKLVRVSSLHQLHRVIPNSTLVIHPTAGHHMMEDEPAWTADALTRFFDS